MHGWRDRAVNPGAFTNRFILRTPSLDGARGISDRGDTPPSSIARFNRGQRIHSAGKNSRPGRQSLKTPT